ncbi:MAG: SURF1 family protein, partial [Pseudomonadota bacterium]
LLSLSFWQFKRLIWKNELINVIEKQIQLPSINLPDKVDMDNMVYRKVSLKGRFMNDYEMYLYGGSRQFKGGNGFFILTPMLLKDNRIVIVNRGWIDEKRRDPEKRPETIISELTEIEGYIMPSENRPLYVHDNQIKINLWFYIDLLEIEGHLNRPVENYYILAKTNKETSLKTKDLSPNIRNNHLGYALIWLFSAIALGFIYVYYHKKYNN